MFGIIKKLFICCVPVVIGVETARADQCVNGYSPDANGDCVVVCDAGYYVPAPYYPCRQMPGGHYYTDTQHTVRYGETSGDNVKKCPSTADGQTGMINGNHVTTTVLGCYLEHVLVRYTAEERGNCVADNPLECHYETHGVADAACMYTTGEDGNAIYDGRETDPVTGRARRGCTALTRLVSCDAGWYDANGGAVKNYFGPQVDPCSPVGTGYYSPMDDLNRYPCPAGTATCGYGDCAASVSDCKPYKTLKTSGGVSLIMYPDRHGSPVLATELADGTRWYARTDIGARTNHINIDMAGIPYAVINPMDLFVEYIRDGYTYMVPYKPNLP